MIATFAIVNGHLGVRLRTICRIRHNHKCVSICKDSHAVLCPLQGRNTQSTNRRFVRWVYFALKRRGLVREVRLLPFVPSHCILLNRIYRSVTRSRHIHQKENLPSEIPMHSYLIQILLPCLFPFFLGWCSPIFCI